MRILILRASSVHETRPVSIQSEANIGSTWKPNRIKVVWSCDQTFYQNLIETLDIMFRVPALERKYLYVAVLVFMHMYLVLECELKQAEDVPYYPSSYK